MNIKTLLRLAVTAVLITLIPSSVFAAVDYGAEIVDIQGAAVVTVKASDETLPAFVGQKLVVGDSVETGGDSEVEILFDDGNVTRLDERSRITIENLSIEDNKSRKSVIGLAFGRVKNSVISLVHKESSFEVHTKSAVAGVRGTPPWVVSAIQGAEHKTEVDLLGKVGREGSIFVQGSDTAATKVTLTPGKRTVVTIGLPPIAPFAIAPDRFKQLQQVMPIRTSPEKMQEKREEIKQKAEEEEEKAAVVPVEEEEVTEEEEPAEETTEETTEESEEDTAEKGTEETTEGSVEESSEAAPVETTEDISVETTVDDVLEESTDTTNTDTTLESASVQTETAPADTTFTTDSSPTTDTTLTLDTSLMMNHLTRKVSVGEVVTTTDGELTTGEETESQLDLGENQVSGAGESSVPSTAAITIRLNVVYP